MRRVSLVLVLLVTPVSPVLAQSTDLNKQEQALRKCFDEGLTEYVEKRQALPVKPQSNEFTELFLASRFARQYAEYLRSATPDAPFQFRCDETLAADYVQALVKAQLERTSTPADHLGQSGTQPLEADDVFIRTGQSVLGSHVKGHSDITQELLTKDLDPADAFEPTAADLLVWSSQAGDLYYWTDATFHAQAAECPDKSPVDGCLKSVKVAGATYHEFLAKRFDATIKAAKGNDDAAPGKALFQLGILLHMVQDLVFHRGMTLAHHAGLSYVRGANPDEPKEAAQLDALLTLARKSSLRTVQLVKSKLTVDEWKRLRTFRPASGAWNKNRKDKQAIAEAVLKVERGAAKKGQDLTLLTLLEYLSLARKYPLGARDPKELDELPKGLWNVEEVLQAFEARVKGS